MNGQNGAFQAVAPKRDSSTVVLACKAANHWSAGPVVPWDEIEIRNEEHPIITLSSGDVDLVNTKTYGPKLMAQIITTYLVVILLVSLGFFGVGALATAQEIEGPIQAPPFELQKVREAK